MSHVDVRRMSLYDITRLTLGEIVEGSLALQQAKALLMDRFGATSFEERYMVERAFYAFLVSDVIERVWLISTEPRALDAAASWMQGWIEEQQQNKAPAVAGHRTGASHGL